MFSFHHVTPSGAKGTVPSLRDSDTVNHHPVGIGVFDHHFVPGIISGLDNLRDHEHS
jgi:hypothetical protein